MKGLELIQVRRYGSSDPTVVVLHGGPGAQGSAAGLARSLARDFKVLEPLQRRSGNVPLTVEQHVEDLAAVAPKPAILIGCSWGAMLGLSYAARYRRSHYVIYVEDLLGLRAGDKMTHRGPLIGDQDHSVAAR